MVTIREGARAALAALAAGALLAGCGLKKRHTCTATASYAGRSVSGRGSDFDDVSKARELARANLCDDYCDNQDPAVDTAVRASLGRPPKDHVERINAVRNPPVKPVFDACLAACRAATARVPIQDKCEVTGVF